MKFDILTWDEVVRMTLRLCQKIRASDFKPSTIVTILRGGLVPARILSDCLKINRFYVMGVSFYRGIAARKGEPVITQPLSVNLEGDKVLLVDDVADTGESILVAKKHILSLGAKDVRVATLHRKPWAKFYPDYYLVESDSWIVYPWEYYETIESLEGKLRTEDLDSETKEAIKGALENIKSILSKFKLE